MGSKAFNKRVIKRFRVEETFTGVVATEDLRQAWIAFAVTVALLVAGGLWMVMERDKTSPTAISILGGIVILLLWAVWPATNLRIVFDQRDDTCLLQKRFYTFVYRTRYLTMQNAAITSRYKQEDSTGTGEAKGRELLGCLLFFLGPLGILLACRQMLAKDNNDTPTHYLVLMHIDRVDGEETILAKVDTTNAMLTLATELKDSVCSDWFSQLRGAERSLETPQSDWTNG